MNIYFSRINQNHLLRILNHIRYSSYIENDIFIKYLNQGHHPLSREFQ